MTQTTTQPTSQTLECPDCTGTFTASIAMVGELVECGDCATELEVRSLDPLRVEVAPELEEDWGE